MSPPGLARFPFEAMGGPGEIVLGGVADPQEAGRLADSAIAEVRRIEAKYSRYRPDSIVSRINAGAGGPPVACDDETWALLDYAGRMHEASDGLFDITAGVLRRAWNFRTPRVPAASELGALRELIGWPRVQRQDGCVRLPIAGMEIDFGGFGKEYAADRAGTWLAGQGIRHGYVNLGGDFRVIGPRPDGQPWRIGIQHPRQADAVVATIPVSQGGLATSGDYERAFVQNGRRYCHILDPRTGLPVTHWQTVSVRAPLAVAAGLCSTVAMLKQAQGLAWLQASGMDFLAVDQHGHCHVGPAALDGAGQPPSFPTEASA